MDTLEEHGLLLKKKIPNQKGYEYFRTKSCSELLPIIKTLGDWGMRWARSNLTEKDYNAVLTRVTSSAGDNRFLYPVDIDTGD